MNKRRRYLAKRRRAQALRARQAGRVVEVDAVLAGSLVAALMPRNAAGQVTDRLRENEAGQRYMVPR